MKLILSILLVFGATVFVQGRLRTLEEIHSAHIPRFLPALNLTTGELKVFAGHSFNLLKNKCPRIAGDKLAQLNKYVAKLVSKTDPIPSKSGKEFKGLVQAITTCSLKERTKKEKSKSGGVSLFQTLLSPFRGLGFFSFKDEDSKSPAKDATKEATPIKSEEPKKPLEEVKTESKPVEAIKSDVNAPSAKVETQEPNASEIPPMEPSELFRYMPTIWFSEDGGDEQPSTVTGATPIEPQSESQSQTPITTTYTSGPFNWFGSLTNMLHNLLANLFGANGDDLGTTSPKERTRRDAIPMPETSRDAVPEKVTTEQTPKYVVPPLISFDEDADVVSAPIDEEKDGGFPLIMYSDVLTKVEKKKGNGESLFLELVDQICSLYCDECNPAQITNFKSAAKELLHFIFADKTGIELASKHFLDADFMKSLQDC